MARRIRCPSCGAEYTLRNPGISMLVCDYCRTAVYWQPGGEPQAGRRSAVLTGESRLFRDATGTLRGQPFRVVGRVRYDHGSGTWDEWYLELGDGGEVWVSESDRELTLERPLVPSSPPPAAEALQPGMALVLEGTTYTVREVGQATCVGGEGQLPFTVLPGERYPYADLATRDGTRFATLEYDEESRPTCFAGEPLDHEELVTEGTPPPSTERAQQGKAIRCANCGASLELPEGREVETLVCAYCGAQLDLTAEEARVLGINPEGYAGAFTFQIGQRGRFLGRDYEICGRMFYLEEETYASQEYLLYNPEAGYLWLVEENGHFVLNRPTRQAPEGNPFGGIARRAYRVGPTTFRYFESGTVVLKYVDGALPWLARSGDTNAYVDLVAPPQLFSVERTGGELEYFHGRYVAPADVWRAFGMEGDPPRPVGVHPAQPYRRSATARTLMIAGAVLAAVNVGLFAWSLARPGRTAFEHTYRAQDYLKESVSPPFDLAAGRIIGLELFAPLQNSWTALDVALVADGQQRVVMEMGGEVSYYSGVEGGESWSEGRRRRTFYYRAPPAGRYRLLFKGSTSRGEPLTVRVREGVVLSRYFLMAAGLAALFPILGIWSRMRFEILRWGGAEAGDDDD